MRAIVSLKQPEQDNDEVIGMYETERGENILDVFARDYGYSSFAHMVEHNPDFRGATCIEVRPMPEEDTGRTDAEIVKEAVKRERNQR